MAAAVASFLPGNGVVLEGGPEEEAILDAAEEVVLRWDPSDSDSSIWASSASAAAEYLSAVDALISVASASSSAFCGRAESVLHIATTRLKRELHRLLLCGTLPLPSLDLRSAPFYGVSPSFHSVLDSPSSYGDSLTSSAATPLADDWRSRASQASSALARPEAVAVAVADLNKIVDRIIWAGHGLELQLIYTAVRHDFISKTLAAVDVVASVSIREVRMINWEILNTKVRTWIHALNVFVKLLLTGERRICDRASLALHKLEEERFAQAAKSGIVQLFNFVDDIIAIAESRHSPEKLFAVLKIYQALGDAAPHLKALLSCWGWWGGGGGFIAEMVDGTLNRLTKEARGLLVEFMASVRGHASRTLSQSGGIHPLAQDVISYVRCLVNHSYSLNLLLDGEVAGSGDENTMTPLGHWVLSLITSLESNIAKESSLYEDEGLKYIFLMNNAHYIITSLSFTELNAQLGDSSIRDRDGRIGQYAHGYLRAAWAGVVSFLTEWGGSPRMALKERLKKFNLAFEEICRVQAAWVVPDPELREQLRIAVADKVVPAYRSFVKWRLAVQVDSRHQAAASYIKWTPEDLEEYVLDLFEGTQEASRRPGRKRAS